MRTHPISLVIAGCLGGVLGWIAHSALQKTEGETSAPRVLETQAQSVFPTGAAADAAAPQSGSNPARVQADAPNAGSAGSTTNAGPDANASNNSQGNGYVSMPDSSADATSASASADSKLPADLQKTMKLWCKYDPGNGAHLRDGIVTKYDLAYQGGPVTFETIDIGAGTARMTGSPGATGSAEGILDVLASTTRAGLHFSAVNSRGELVVTTVFGAVDKNGRHPSVMTTHGMHAFNGSYQIYGTCEL